MIAPGGVKHSRRCKRDRMGFIKAAACWQRDSESRGGAFHFSNANDFMDTVTQAFQKYRIAARLIWNLFFLPNPELAGWDGRDQFERIKGLLFESLVLGSVSVDMERVRFVVVPRAEAGVPIRIESPRQDDRNHYWDHPISTLKPSDATLEFLDFFDFDPIGYLDFRYVRTRICDFPAHSDLVGREALLDTDYVDICVCEK